MSKVRTPLFWNVERTCRIGVGVKTASHGEVLDEQSLALREAFQWSQVQPGLPLVGQLLVRHAKKDMSVNRGVTSDGPKVHAKQHWAEARGLGVAAENGCHTPSEDAANTVGTPARRWPFLQKIWPIYKGISLGAGGRFGGELINGG